MSKNLFTNIENIPGYDLLRYDYAIIQPAYVLMQDKLDMFACAIDSEADISVIKNHLPSFIKILEIRKEEATPPYVISRSMSGFRYPDPLDEIMAELCTRELIKLSVEVRMLLEKEDGNGKEN